MLITNIKGFHNACFDAYDLGLYSQAILDIANFESFNPYVPIRGLKILNDHFMPAIYLSLPFVWISSFSPLGLIIFEWFCFLSFIFLVIKEFEFKFNSETLFGLSLIIFCKAFITALIFPIHPGVWSVPVLFLLIKAIKENNQRKVIFFSLFLMLFRESFPFVVIGLSFWYLLTKKYRTFAILFLSSSLYLVFVLFGRKYFWGETYGYGKEIVTPLVTDTIRYITFIISNFKYSAFLKSFYPFLIPLFFIFKYDVLPLKRRISHFSFAVAFMTLPLWGIHFVANKVDFQYSAPMFAPLLCLIILSSFFKRIQNNKKMIIFTLVLFIASSMSFYKRFSRILFSANTHRCDLREGKEKAIKEISKLVDGISKDKKILATRRIVPNIIRPGLGVWTTHYFTKQLKSYDYLFFEKDFVDRYPTVSENYNHLIMNCKKANVVIDNKYVLVLKGNIYPLCFKPLIEKRQYINY
jgi:hypothetical protein